MLVLNTSMNLVMIKYFVMRNFRGKCSSGKMRKGHMVKKKVGNPDLERLIRYW